MNLNIIQNVVLHLKFGSLRMIFTLVGRCTVSEVPNIYIPTYMKNNYLLAPTYYNKLFNIKKKIVIKKTGSNFVVLLRETNRYYYYHGRQSFNISVWPISS